MTRVSHWRFDEATRRGRVCACSLAIVLISVWRVSSHHADPNTPLPAFFDWAVIALAAPAALYNAMLELRCRAREPDSSHAKPPLGPFVFAGLVALGATGTLLGLALWVLGVTPWAFMAGCAGLVAAILGSRRVRARSVSR
jgi:hypothetical protein